MKKWLLLLAVSSAFVACEEKEDDNLYSAQICINNADKNTVDGCLAKIAGISSARAFVLRCSADFIREDFTTEKIVEAIEHIDENNTGSDPTIDFYNQFAFGSTALADAAVANCTASGSKGLKLLALCAKTATVIKHDILNGSDIDAGSIAALDPGNDATPQELQAIGEAVLQIAPLACAKGASLEKSEICDNINAAIASSGGDTQALGEAYLQQLQNSNN